MPSKVLIVDDDKTTREGLAEFLEEAGLRSRRRRDVRRGDPHPADRRRPDLLIADVRLGPFNGLQLVISSPQPIPAIIITGFADPVLEADARRRGADYVLKPVSPARLLDLVAQKLAAARPGFGIAAPLGTETGHRRAADQRRRHTGAHRRRQLRRVAVRDAAPARSGAAGLAQHHAAHRAAVGQGEARLGEPDWRAEHGCAAPRSLRKHPSGTAWSTRSDLRPPPFSPSLPTRAPLSASPTTTSEG